MVKEDIKERKTNEIRVTSDILIKEYGYSMFHMTNRRCDYYNPNGRYIYYYYDDDVNKFYYDSEDYSKILVLETYEIFNSIEELVDRIDPVKKRKEKLNKLNERGI